MNLRVVLIEDDDSLRERLADALSAAGWRVDRTADGKDGLYQLTEYPCDIAIVDLGLPGLDGLEVIRRARAVNARLPILVLTARDRWQDKVEGLEAGADDYLTKPFHVEELQARLRALVRRSLQDGQERLDFGPLVIDTATDTVLVHGEAVTLTTFEYRLLLQLVRQAGRPLSKDMLADYLYEHDDDRESNVIEVLIGRLRRKLDPDGRLGVIETLRGRGYRFTLQPAEARSSGT
ncbi:two component transcriptional regulator, winged helix family [Thioalkalivibrio nitratireducens DSM 14787]|uniref:Two component transcriptional regulator, winged helix family n=1 Tax=Thioalkalivibrio nitratireducens (strain DSM 14787 / UNIQEM 213 / ALEN2) TaxID=1255043 RepID=L0DTC3_THIND|nr:response regulator transcription factor [Thioalkalivibrio nitratireducens]AGA32258.1 two component transcriptional regulator, winged helix family [Thioalkalivibrio nitratireducens DSM 14787]